MSRQQQMSSYSLELNKRALAKQQQAKQQMKPKHEESDEYDQDEQEFGESNNVDLHLFEENDHYVHLDDTKRTQYNGATQNGVPDAPTAPRLHLSVESTHLPQLYRNLLL